MSIRDFVERHRFIKEGPPAIWIWGAVAFLVLEVAFMVFIDRPVAERMKALDVSAHALIDFFRSITDFAKGGVYLWPCGIATLFCAFLSRGKDIPKAYRDLCGYVGVRALFIFGAVGVSGLVVDVLKPLLGRGRPKLWLNEGVYGFDPFTFFVNAWNGLPSGHSATAFAAAFALAKLYPKASAVWWIGALVLASSRIMVDAHYLSDVLAGAVLGCITAAAFSRYGITPLARVIFPIDKRPFLK